MLKNHKAFTLSEVLMVLALIGIVSAMTLPKLGDNVAEQGLVAMTKKVANDLQTAYKGAVAQYGQPDGWVQDAVTTIKDDNGNEVDIGSSDATDKFVARYKEFLDVAYDCGTNEEPCMPPVTTTASSHTTSDFPDGTRFLQLKNGAGLAIFLYDATIDLTSGLSSALYPCEYGMIYVDVNGSEKDPNMKGYDVFKFVLTANGVEPVGYTSSGIAVDKTDYSKNTAWVIKVGNEDYIDCASSLNWTTKKVSCK